MNRREVFGALGAGVAGLAAVGAGEAGAQHPHHHDKLHGDCLKACQECATVCNETFHHCFEQVRDGHKQHYRAASLTVDCQEFCRLSAELMSRESELINAACLACAEACQKCAEECAKHDDDQMKECVRACRTCEATCRAMAKAPALRPDTLPDK